MKINLSENDDDATPRCVSQPIVMRTPSFIDVVKGVGNPLLLENSVPLLAHVERLASPEVSVLFSMSIQIDRTPEAKAVASDDDNHRCID